MRTALIIEVDSAKVRRFSEASVEFKSITPKPGTEVWLVVSDHPPRIKRGAKKIKSEKK